MSSPALLEIDDLAVTYRLGRRRSVPAVSGVSLEVGAGETLGLVGESGSGKTTIGRAVLGLAPVTSGSIRFAGADITHANASTRRSLSQQIQVVFQDPYSSFNPSRTIGQTVAETLVTQRDLSRDEVARRTGDLLERVGLDRAAATRYPSQFSGGQRQRIAIARALMPSPRLVICDEAVSALDLSVQAQVLNLLADLQDEFGVAYLFITHDLAVVRHVCDRVAVLRRGVLVETGDVGQVCERPTDAYTAALVAAAPVADPAEQRQRRATRAVALAGVE